jgi:hypothetical protein
VITEYLGLDNSLILAEKSKIKMLHLMRAFLLHHPLAEGWKGKKHMGERAIEGQAHFYNKPIPVIMDPLSLTLIHS